MGKERILIAVKTYPTLSRKYGETVCTAGVREDGSWVRIYPVPFRRLNEKEQYSKFDWVECDLRRNVNDPRPESHCPLDMSKLVKVGHVATTDNWRERREILLKRATVHTRMQELIEGAKANRFSLAVFKPTRIRDFIWEPEDREWSKTKLAEMRKIANQGDLFAEEAWRKTFAVIPKLPYSFSYRFEDADGNKSTLQILDWEIGALFWKCRKQCGGDEEQALVKVREKYMDAFLGTDLHFFLGTTQQYHFFGRNPWVIIGVFYIPSENQLNLF